MERHSRTLSSLPFLNPLEVVKDQRLEEKQVRSSLLVPIQNEERALCSISLMPWDARSTWTAGRGCRCGLLEIMARHIKWTNKSTPGYLRKLLFST
jgi:hypothetical protein